MLRLPRTIRSQTFTSVLRAFSTTPRQAVSAPGPKDGPKGNATGLDTNTDGMKPGNDNTSKTPVDQQAKTPNIEGGEGKDAHPAKQPEAQPEPTRSTGIKGKEEMG
jgi:hypothetical protein